ncbi:MAG: hypothetical protein K2X99_03870 [Gemmatimonadaceae bacterium]|nr:hypothetical protein [Gemmatimonadaceae bacterium]
MRNATVLRALSATALLVPALALAQGPGDATAIGLPQFVSYDLTSGGTTKRISQFSLPFAVIVPIGQRVSLDVSTAYALSQVKQGATTVELNGLTDTQVRANFTMLGDAAVVTLGVNVPTGQYAVPDNKLDAAGQIGNDFLVYPVSSYGNGVAGTGGIAFAKSLGSWNLGVGGTLRKSGEFDAFTTGTQNYRFQPADEYRIRAGLDRQIGDGSFGLGLTYSAFGDDLADTTTYSTGDRYIGTLNYFLPRERWDLSISGWDLYRAEGQQVGGTAPYENVANLSATVGFGSGAVRLEPSAEGRFWQVGGNRAGRLLNAGLRARLGSELFTVVPAATYSVGTLYSPIDGAATDVTGFRASLLIRIH